MAGDAQFINSMDGQQPEGLLEELLDRYENLAAQGQSVAVVELCRDCPELVGELQRRIDALKQADAVLALAEGEQEPPKQLGRYRLDQLLGEGGFGQVWRGFDTELHRAVAVKFFTAWGAGSSGARALFRKEAQKVANLHHPHIVPVYDIGQEGSYDFIVYQLIEGTSLAKRIAEARPSFKESARIVAQVAEALHHAHLCGIVHRDVKPSNILLDKEGRAYLTDFGIAADEEELLYHHGPTSGTLPYMSPEQLKGENLRVTPRSDVYSLGVVFYELLTGRRPFQAKQPDILREQILTGELRPPRTIDDKIPKRLEAICLKALRREPGHRYATARDMARELRRSISPIPRRRILVACAALALIAMAVVLMKLILPPRPRLSGEVEIRIWSNSDPSRIGFPLDSPHILPVRAGDGIRVNCTLNRPAYLYLVWIDAHGNLLPLYPWKPGTWDRPSAESRRDSLILPEAGEQIWPLEGGSGMETLLLLACDDPLPASCDLQALLAGLPKPPPHDPRAMVRFADGMVVAQTPYPLHRGPRLAPQPLGDPLLKMHAEIHLRLMRQLGRRTEFTTRGVSFYFQGDQQQ